MRSLLFQIARSAPSSVLVRFVFAHAVWLLPLRFVARTPRAVIFDHPRPRCAGHLLAVPRRAIRGLPTITAKDRPWLASLCELAFTRVAADPTAEVLVINAYAWQEVPQLHLHLLPRSEAPTYAHEISLALEDPVTTLERARHVMRTQVPEGHGCALLLDPEARTARVVWGTRS